MAERVYCLYRVSTAKQVDQDEQNQADIPMQSKACQAASCFVIANIPNPLDTLIFGQRKPYM